MCNFILLSVWKCWLNVNRKTVKNQLSTLKKKVLWKYVWTNKEHNYRWLWKIKKCGPGANKPNIKDDLHTEKPELAKRVWLAVGKVIKNEVIKNSSGKRHLGSAIIGEWNEIRHKSSWWILMPGKLHESSGILRNVVFYQIVLTEERKKSASKLSDDLTNCLVIGFRRRNVNINGHIIKTFYSSPMTYPRFHLLILSLSSWLAAFYSKPFIKT